MTSLILREIADYVASKPIDENDLKVWTIHMNLLEQYPSYIDFFCQKVSSK